MRRIGEIGTCWPNLVITEFYIGIKLAWKFLVNKILNLDREESWLWFDLTSGCNGDRIDFLSIMTLKN